MTDCEGYIFNIQRAALDDGPGVRTALFFKGCPLSCFWCHNPESQRALPELLARADKCRKCGACEPICPMDAIKNADVDRTRCAACGACAKACDYGALEIVGRRYTARDAAREALLDKAFFEATGGGVTLTGGEPLMQADFALEILKMLKREGIHTCVETCGVCADGVIVALAPYVDHWLYDVKLTDEKAHQSLLNVPLSAVLRGLYILKNMGASVTLRCPIIPGINDNTAHFEAIRELARGVEALAVDILPYHRLGRDKYCHLGREIPKEIPVPDADAVMAWEKAVMPLKE